MLNNNKTDNSPGNTMMGWARELFPICRSITGQGLRQTLNYIKSHLKNQLSIVEVSSGTQVFDWVIPKEWNIKDAWVKNSAGQKVIDFQKSNLHVVNYSVPVHQTMSLEELNSYLYSKPELPEAIPYMTSYYRERWGFCLSENQRRQLPEDEYEVFIDSDLSDGSLSYGELLIKGSSSEEVLLSTYVCHPSMANNELSGPIVTMALAQWLMAQPDLKYSYRIVFVPESIGALAYLNANIEVMQEKTKAGFVVTCVGDDRCYSYMPSRTGDTLSDRVAKVALKQTDPEFKQYSFLQRGSDERQYCAPKVNLPVASMMRSKYAEYPEYHTSLDNLSLISEQGLSGALKVYQDAIELLEQNQLFEPLLTGEPQLGKRNLYSSLGQRDNQKIVPRNLLNFLAYVDGENDLIDIAEIINIPIEELVYYTQICEQEKLIAVKQ